jgi:membrane protease YdiL (CAAX protease family)
VTSPPTPGPAGTHPGSTDSAVRRVPRWGSVAHPRGAGPRPSTGPGGTGPSGVAGAGAAVLVVGGGVAFLLARSALGGVPGAGVLLGVGYLVLGTAAVLVPRPGTEMRRVAPRGRGGPLVAGRGALVAAVAVAGPVPDRRVGAAAAGLALMAAVTEEALFRRVLYDRLERFGPAPAVLGSAVVFALVHLPAYGAVAMPVDLGAGLLLSWQRYASGRWTVPAVTHAIANLLAVT